MTALRLQQGGAGSPVLLLIHGMGATSDVWDGLRPILTRRWLGRWLAPDLPGHGESAPLDHYSFGHLAAALAPAVAGADPVVILGHSLGGVIGLALASGWFGVRVAGVVGLGIKVRWTDDELAKARSLAGRVHPVYSTRAEAAERHLKLAGLLGLLEPDQVPDAALRHTQDGWTVRFDPAAFAMGAPDMPGLLATAKAPVILAAGERDPMSPREHLATLIEQPVSLAGLGHNAQVEDPEAVWSLVETITAQAAMPDATERPGGRTPPP